MKILILGGVSYDSIIQMNDLPEKQSQTLFAPDFNEVIGSTGTGKALNLNKLGFDTTLHSIIGTDYYGELVKQYFNKNRVNFITDSVAKTERHTNIMDREGNRISIFTVPPESNPLLKLDEIELEIKKADLIILNIVGYTKQFIPLIKKYNKPIWTDLHDYDGLNSYHQDYIDCSSVVFLSSEKLDHYQPVMEHLMKQGKELVVCTHGKRGVTALTKDLRYYDQSILDDYEFIDSNGAGDSFFSGFLYGYINKRTIEECLRYGTICGGLCITSKELVYQPLSVTYLEEQYANYFKF